jgi:hypothetical protein
MVAICEFAAIETLHQMPSDVFDLVNLEQVP